MYTECDGTVCTAAQWRVVVEGWNIISDVVTSITRGDGTATIGNSPYDVYYDFDAAVKSAVTLSTGNAQNLIFSVDTAEVCDSSGNYLPKVHVFTDSATVNQAQFDAEADPVNNNTVSIVNVKSGTDLVVMSFVPQNNEGGNAVYFAFYVEK